MRKKLRILLMLLLAAVFLTSLGLLLRQNLQYRHGEQVYTEAQTLAELPAEEQAETPAEDPCAGVLGEVDLSALRQVNPDVLGWIVIPDTELNYPLLQGEDNQFYLKHDWKKESASVGSIFLEAACSPDFSDFNTVIYGHRMRNGSMFAVLQYYEGQDFWAAHPWVYIANDRGRFRYEIFAAYEVSVTGPAYRLGFPDEGSRQAFLDDCLALSVIDTGVVPSVDDSILTLSTCAASGYATRWVVQARLAGADG